MNMTPHGKIAVEFASALVAGEFVRAHTLLAPPLRQRLTPDRLRDSFYAMFRGYSDGEPKRIHFPEGFMLENWPGKLPADIGSAYVGIEGDDFNEGVAVVVAEVETHLLIRDIEWGRP